MLGIEKFNLWKDLFRQEKQELMMLEAIDNNDEKVYKQPSIKCDNKILSLDDLNTSIFNALCDCLDKKFHHLDVVVMLNTEQKEISVYSFDNTQEGHTSCGDDIDDSLINQAQEPQSQNERAPNNQKIERSKLWKRTATVLGCAAMCIEAAILYTQYYPEQTEEIVAFLNEMFGNFTIY